ncbi:MAG: TlyA family RNA methyltransferase [Crocinitomicaceae bacterium]|jgi:23S rRNA (cytidine1920-2'-O)/16S rRNA (cytidine1409-2'-O)-methyltransferase|nr:TlyA family RNA methyltransferase [Crocinitomicaceae bacterium]
MEERLDKLIVNRGLVSSRVRAEEIIREHGVLVNGKLINKTGKKFPEDVTIELTTEEIPYVSRGALKLLKAFESFPFEVDKHVCLDIGASTGGFTQVLLEKGATKVFALDVGTDQLHEDVKSDKRVINLEKTNIREINHQTIPEFVDTVVIDVSFISLEKVFPFFHPFVKENGTCIALIKPQFEVGKENLGKKGIVKKKELYPQVIEKITAVANTNHFELLKVIESPILGGDGNREFLGHFRKIEERKTI